MSTINAMQTSSIMAKHATSPCPTNFRSAPNTTTIIKVMVKGGKITTAEFKEALDVAYDLQESPENVLKRCWGLSSHDWELAKEAARLIEDNLITKELAMSGFEIASRKGISLICGLRYFGYGW